MSRRGKPIELISDNGTNFVDAKLREFIQSFDPVNDLSAKGISWKFKSAVPPHMGGI